MMTNKDLFDKDTEQIREIFKEMEIDTDRFTELYSRILKSYGEFSLSFGEIQREYGEYLNLMLEHADKIPSLMVYMFEKGPPEKTQGIFSVYLKLFALLPKMSKMMELSADEKILLGKQLISLADEFKRLNESMKQDVT